MRRPQTFWWCLALIATLFVAQGVRLAHRMVTWTDESAYVNLGYLVASGQVSLFQDEMTGSRVPLPFWVLGLSQVAWGRSLLAARLASLALAVVALVFAALLARRLRGDVAGLLAAAFLATQGVLVGYFATATYHGLAAAILLGGLILILSERQPAGRLLGMVVVSLLFLVRTNLWPILPAVFLAVLLQGRNRSERLWSVVAAVAVPILFFVSDLRHLKLLLYVPVVNKVTAWFGYSNPWSLIKIPQPSWGDRVWALVRFGRMYEFWVLALALLAMLILLHRFRGLPTRPFFEDRRLNLLGALAVYIGVWQVIILREFPKALVAWFPSWAPLVAIVLGAGFATAFARGGFTRTGRAALATVLALIMLAPTFIIRHPLLPSGAAAAASPLRDLSAAADHFGRLIPSGSTVFLWGDPLPLYLAGLTPYLRQIHSPFTLAAEEDRAAIEESGLWGQQEMQAWLGRDAQYAVLEQRVVDHYRHRAPDRLAEVERLLEQNFVRLERVEDYRWFAYDVYVRRAATDRRTATGSGR